ncbi:uncharacterized protein LOC101846973 [Aplysia californica]|uniref:Uncharacterized protein LOC101846973 n=1 Tax=Aplysia californica TaxID=6500 RepID=A0ABM0JUP5_APLCA|nr:uncharacterized protein LOC101846973 [Aplysia californica]
MASKTDWSDCLKISAIFYTLTLNVKSVEAYYCDNDRCTEEEYCCGDNVCCPSYKVLDLWYLWCGILFFMFLLSLCTCLWRYRFLSRGAVIIRGYTYTPLQEMDAVDTRPDAPVGRYARGFDKPAQPPVGTPPPYSQVSASNVKISTPPPPYAQVVGMRDSH